MMALGPVLAGGGFMALLAGMMLTALIIGIALYVYMAVALMTIARKTKTENAWLAWIPIANLYLMTQVARVPWWTMLVILVAWVPFIGSLAVLGVMIWWWWLIAERRGKQGALALLMLIPVIGAFIVAGYLAWSK